MTAPRNLTKLVDHLSSIYKDGSILVDYNNADVYYSYITNGDMITHRIRVCSNNFIVQEKNFSGLYTPTVIQEEHNFDTIDHTVCYIRNRITSNLRLANTNIITLLTTLCDSGYDAIFEHNSYVNAINIDIDFDSSLTIVYNTHNNINRYECTVTHNGFTSDKLYLDNSFDVLCWVEEVNKLRLDADDDNMELVNLFQMLYKKYLYKATIEYDEYDAPVIDLTDFEERFARFSKQSFNSNEIQCVVYDSNGPVDGTNLNLLAANSKEAMNWAIAKFAELSK